MAVDDTAADVSVSGGTPALRLEGARAAPYGGSHASRSEDYMNNPHLCPTAAQELDKARSDAAAGLVQAMPWRETTPGKLDEPGPGGFERTAAEPFVAEVGRRRGRRGDQHDRGVPRPSRGSSRRSSRARSPSASKEAAAP